MVHKKQSGIAGVFWSGQHFKAMTFLWTGIIIWEGKKDKTSTKQTLILKFFFFFKQSVTESFQYPVSHVPLILRTVTYSDTFRVFKVQTDGYAMRVLILAIFKSSGFLYCIGQEGFFHKILQENLNELSGQPYIYLYRCIHTHTHRNIIGSMDMSLSKVREIVKERETWYAAVHGVAKSQTRLSTWTITIYRFHLILK